MKRSIWKLVGGCFLAALLFSPAWGSVSPQPGTVNYIEGQAAIGSRALTEQSVGSASLGAGQTLTTENGRAEILLTPGVFLRVDSHSAVRMVSAGLANSIMTLEKGRAMVEVTYILPQNNIRIAENGASTQLLKAGLYDFDANRGLIRVFDGKAVVQMGRQQVELKHGHQLAVNTTGKLKAHKFDKEAQVDDFYRWASLRSSYLAEANVDAARRYAGASGWSPDLWYGNGWYWDPWFDAYTFIPGDGIFFDPFGWGFYSPWLAFGAPYYGYGYGGYGYGGYGYAAGAYHHFGPGYRRPFGARTGSSAAVGHAFNVRGGGTVGLSRGGGFGGAGFRGMGGGGFHGGGGFGGGGFGGGGFHGGGGGHGR